MRKARGMIWRSMMNELWGMVGGIATMLLAGLWALFQAQAESPVQEG